MGNFNVDIELTYQHGSNNQSAFRIYKSYIINEDFTHFDTLELLNLLAHYTPAIVAAYLYIQYCILVKTKQNERIVHPKNRKELPKYEPTRPGYWGWGGGVVEVGVQLDEMMCKYLGTKII